MVVCHLEVSLFRINIKEEMMSMTIDRLPSYQRTATVTSDSSRAESRLCVRDAASPAQMLPPAPGPAGPSGSSGIKNERSSPQCSTISRSRSVSPSGSSYPSTTPERASPLAPPAPILAPRNYSDIMRTLAARYNESNDYYHRLNGCVALQPQTQRQPQPQPQPQLQPQPQPQPQPPPQPQPQPQPAQAQPHPQLAQPLGGLFSKMAMQGGPCQIPAFPATYDMSATKALLELARHTRRGRMRRKRIKGLALEHDWGALDLSTAGEITVKRARTSTSPSEKSDGDDRLNGDSRQSRDCLCAEARARLSAMSVEDVCSFVYSIDICAEYSSNFREQRIDGASLPLLTEEHLTGMLQMKLGPALKLRAAIAKSLVPCAQCQASNAMNAVGMNGFKPEPRSSTTSPS